MENAYVPARALQHSSTKELDYKYCAATGWIVFPSAYKPIDGSGTPLEAVQGEATGVGRLYFIERNPPTVGQRACRFATATTNL